MCCKEKFPCDIPGCDEEFVTKDNMERHKKRVHENSAELYKCNICPHEAKSKGELKTHYAKCFVEIEPRWEDTWLTCRYCQEGQEYRSQCKAGIDQHVKKHENEEEHKEAYQRNEMEGTKGQKHHKPAKLNIELDFHEPETINDQVIHKVMGYRLV